jgi:hypothetical protein
MPGQNPRTASPNEAEGRNWDVKRFLFHRSGGDFSLARQRKVGETAEAPPVADEARLFRGSVPSGGPARGRESADTTVIRIPAGTPQIPSAPQGRSVHLNDKWECIPLANRRKTRSTAAEQSAPAGDSPAGALLYRAIRSDTAGLLSPARRRRPEWRCGPDRSPASAGRCPA